LKLEGVTAAPFSFTHHRDPLYQAVAAREEYPEVATAMFS